jgi:cytochrome P450
MQDAAARHSAHWRPGEPFILDETTQAISLEVIIRAVFGVVAADRVEIFRRAVLDFTAAIHPLIMFRPSLAQRLGRLGPWARFRRASGDLRELLVAEIASRRAEGDARGDVLRLMIDARHDDGQPMSDQEIHDELMTLLFAGHETTAIGLAWACYWIHRDDAVRRRLLAELASAGPTPEPEAVAALPYLDAVCKEALRLHPVVPEVLRRLKAPLAFRDFVIPAGCGVACCIALTHAREDVYPEPQRFRPERFLERQYSPFEYLPFGGGPHRCIGAAFALYEMKLVLATLLVQHDLRLVDNRELRPRRRSVTFGPGGGVKMVINRAN